jgi:proteasome lid subunit RPN8/RPN11
MDNNALQGTSARNSKPTLELPPAVRARLEHMAREGYPSETCGLLIGRDNAVARAVPARNLVRERAGDRYELDPADHFAAEQEARAEGLEVIGVWHTHPDHPARPSETDRAAAWPGWSYLILAVIPGGVTDIRSWRLAGEHFVEQAIR